MENIADQRTKGWTGLLIDGFNYFPSYVSFIGYYLSERDSPTRFASLKRPDELEELYQQARSAPEEDPEMLRNLHKLLLEDATVIPLTMGSRYYMYQPYVRDAAFLNFSVWPYWSPGSAWLDR